MTDISRIPVSDISSVRGIGVALIDSTSTDRADGLHLFLVLDAEPLFLVDDDQPDVLEPRVRLQQAVRADDEIDGAVADPGDDGLLLGVGVETRHARRPSPGTVRAAR